MSWECEALWAKAVLFMQRAVAEDRESAEFGLWASLGLELLARAAVAKTSPALLAEPDREQKNLLHALGISTHNAPKSIGTVQVFSLCRLLVAGFTEDEFRTASSLLNRRNEELHSGAAAFEAFPTHTWLAPFYRCCQILAEHVEESLESLFGKDEAQVATEILGKVEASVIGNVKASIAAHTKVFNAKEEAERVKLSAEAEAQANGLAHRGHHRVTCPACGSRATVQGKTYGGERLEHRDGQIVVRENVLPTKFQCQACGLKLTGYQELVAAGVGDHFTHRTEYSPPDYYELVDPNDHESMAEYAENHGYYQFSNE
jgi:transcription elongation factor Elf1